MRKSGGGAIDICIRAVCAATEICIHEAYLNVTMLLPTFIVSYLSTGADPWGGGENPPTNSHFRRNVFGRIVIVE